MHLVGTRLMSDFIHEAPRPPYTLLLSTAYYDHIHRCYSYSTRGKHNPNILQDKISIYVEWYNQRLDDPDSDRNHPYKRIKNL